MAETSVADPVAVDSMIRRQSISEANHVNRIRSANSKRLSVLLSSTELVSLQDSGTSRDTNEENVEKRMSMSDFSNNQKPHQDYLESLDELRTRVSNQSLVDSDRSTEKSRKLSISPYSSATRKSTVAVTQSDKGKERKSSLPRETSSRRRTTVFQERTTVKTESSEFRKTNTVNDEKNINLQKRRRSSTLRKPYQAGKLEASKRRRSTSVNRDRSKNSDKEFELSSPNNKSEFDRLVEISDCKGNIISNDLPSTRGAVILKWLHEINCPLSDTEKSTSDSLEKIRSPIRILKKVPEVGVKKSKEKSPDKEKFPRVRKKSKLLSKIGESPTSEENEKTVDSHYEASKHGTDSLGEVPKYVSNVEMHVSELGKLQIILDSKDLSSDDAAIVIWIDDIPRSFYTPEYGRRLSLAPDLLTSEISTTAVHLHPSSSPLEDMPSLKPDIYFPPVTILKNTAVDSRYGMRKLSDYYDNTVLYKRCNINHVEWGFNGQ